MRRNRFQFAAEPVPQPISELNTTPLIDVMLVLLVMMILTVPIMNHKVPLDLPQGTGSGHPAVHRLALAALRADRDQQLHLSAEATTPYDAFDRTLALVKRAGITKLGLVGNERFAAFDR